MTQETTTPDLTSYDLIYISTSGGKDSQAAQWIVYNLAKELGITDRLRAVHADLGDAEWEGTTELVQEQCEMLEIPLEIVKRPQGTLLERVEERGKWFSPAQRYCTSDFKRDQIRKVYTQASRDYGKGLRILEIMGLRAEESPNRAKLEPFTRNQRASTKTGTRIVDTWLPIHDFLEGHVWATIEESGIPHHYAYDLGMPRLSCAFCMMAPKHVLKLSGKHNPEKLQQYVEMEQKIDHKFTASFSLEEIQAEIQEEQNTDNDSNTETEASTPGDGENVQRDSSAGSESGDSAHNGAQIPLWSGGLLVQISPHSQELYSNLIPGQWSHRNISTGPFSRRINRYFTWPSWMLTTSVQRAQVSPPELTNEEFQEMRRVAQMAAHIRSRQLRKQITK